MAISELLKVVAPPANPVEAQNGTAWERAQQVVGIKLPKDFRDFATHYGSGEICGYLSIINPLANDFEVSVSCELETLRDNKASEGFPYEVFPDEPGLLPWGGDDNGNVFHWLTDGEPDCWPVVVESHDGDFERFDMCMTTFLAKALTNEIRPKHIWYRPFTEEERIFVPKR